MATLTYKEVQEQFPEAWAALPSPYQNDSCLSFYADNPLVCEGRLCCKADLGMSIPMIYLWLEYSRQWKEI